MMNHEIQRSDAQRPLERALTVTDSQLCYLRDKLAVLEERLRTVMPQNGINTSATGKEPPIESFNFGASPMACWFDSMNQNINALNRKIDDITNSLEL